ncbi:MAG: hypothetical protein ACXU8U_11360 [Asticcacaulis sp.]
MGESVQFFWAMLDAGQAALIALNPVPVIVLALLIGLVQPGRGFTLLKSVAAVVPALIVAALWPQVYGMSPIWPDLAQIETQIQIAVQLIVAALIIRGLWSVKVAAAHALHRPIKA